MDKQQIANSVSCCGLIAAYASRPPFATAAPQPLRQTPRPGRMLSIRLLHGQGLARLLGVPGRSLRPGYARRHKVEIRAFIACIRRTASAALRRSISSETPKRDLCTGKAFSGDYDLATESASSGLRTGRR
jgi:hypothetical protein